MSLYRFSISWSRILPTGNASDVNDAGLQYYTNLIDALLDEDITPIVAMHYYDMPIAIYSEGGWKNETTVQLFVDYARLLFTRLGSRVSIIMIFEYSKNQSYPIYTGIESLRRNRQIVGLHSGQYIENGQTGMGRITR